ncbi:hypothetical protein COLU111180_13370 [Cohnella lubricantis]|uniref:Heme-binding protein Shr-like Hb-interacting domain-containing protein n=1 Tax=Cohnella lubricantis TaxID=2163172 RepID=A0A841T913_9BACL|nr:hypothetical protein [Cohnella lubricantis]MBB6675918.1 hypothetical protein [Cohnella lubricantis]MBP2117165.1 hypothetical protein [Cohnella lubricantis]
MKQNLRRWLSLATVMAVLAVTLLANVAPAAYAAGSDITIERAVFSNNNRDIIVTFNEPVEVKPGVTDQASRVGLKPQYIGYYMSVSEGGGTLEISDAGELIVHLNSTMPNGSYQIRILAGTLQGSEDSGYQQTSELISELFSSYTIPAFQSVALTDENDVTITLNTSVTAATYSVSGATYNYDPHEFVQIRKNGDPDYSELDSDDIVTVSDDLLNIDFASPLADATQYSIKVLAGAVQSAPGITNSEFTVGVNTKAPTYSSSSKDEYSSYSRIYVNYDQNIYKNGLSDDELKAAVTISSDGGDSFEQLAEDAEVYISGSNYLTIYFDSPLAAGDYQVKIGAGALKNSVGVPSNVVTTPAITFSDLTGPEYQSLELSEGNTKVTLTFDDNIYIRNGYNLVNYIYIRKDGSSLPNNDWIESAVTSGNQLVITLSKPLVGNGYQFVIYYYVLQDENGNSLKDSWDVVTDLIDTANPDSPAYDYSKFSNTNHDLTLYFDAPILNNTASNDALKAGIALSVNGGAPHALAASTTVTITGQTILLHFADPLVDPNIQVHIAANTLKSESGHALANPITTEAVFPNTLYPPELDDAYLISSHTAVVEFDTNDGNLADNTPGTDESNLKTAVSYSLDHGSTFLPLGTDDDVILNDSQLLVYFHEALTGEVQIRIAGSTLKNSFGNVLTEAVTTEELTADAPYNISGDAYTDAPSVITFDDDPVWREHISGVGIYNDNTGQDQELAQEDYTISPGKITIRQGVFEEFTTYYFYIDADGYDNRDVELFSHPVQMSFAMGPVKTDSANGITASVKVAPYASYLGSQATVIFQLMDGEKPVSIAAIHTDVLDDIGTFTAHFNAADATDTTNHDYTVRAYVVDQYTNDPSSVGYDLATRFTEAEMESNEDLQDY